MSRIQLNKEKILRLKVVPDFFELAPAKANKSLDRITEVTEPNTSFFRKDLTPTPVPSSSEFKNNSQISPFYLSFLQSLQKFDKIYFFFIQKCYSSKLIKKRNNLSFPAVKINRTIEILSIEDTDNSPSLIEGRRKSSFLRYKNLTSNTTKAINYTQLLNSTLEKSKKEAKFRRFDSRASTPNQDLKSIKGKKNFKLDPNDEKIKKIFREIVGNYSKVNNVNFAEYLKLRYPELIVASMIKYFEFQSETIEGYVVKMNKFLNLNDKTQMKFCFEIFDLNKDGFVDYQDAFKALEIRKENLYDEDFIVLRELLQLKFEGKLVLAKKKRKSTFGLIRERIEKKFRCKIEVPVVLQDPGVRIDFAEFRLAKFFNKPKILKDFLKYTCAFSFEKSRKIGSKQVKLVRKESENIVIDMNLDENYKNELAQDPKFNYYCELDEIMSKYQENQLKVQLEKFKFLKSSEKFIYQVITQESMIEKFVRKIQPRLIGFDSKYLSIRIFDILSKGKYLTKSRFLNSILPFLHTQSTTEVNYLAFSIIDKRQDQKITVDEITSLFHSLTYGSAAYFECLK